MHSLHLGSEVHVSALAWLSGGGFSHVYYFASPPIEKNLGPWSDDIFERLANVYVRGFAAVMAALDEGRDSPMGQPRVLYPSTVFLDTTEAGFAEYCAAKAAGEVLAKQFARRTGAIVATPRLPRMRTDQTNGLSNLAAVDPLPVMFETLSRFNA